METSKRINRVIGQLKGIQKMLEAKRSCVDILQQISAVKKAIDGLSKEILVTEIFQFIPPKDSKEVRQIVERSIDI
jgi:DNA-binding FrmR family transcriptional regulator